MTLARRAWDVYNGEDIHGTRLVRLTGADVLEGTGYRHVYRGMGAGNVVVRRQHASVAAGHFAQGNYVRCVNLDTDAVDGGFFLDEGEEVVLSDKTKALKMGGPSTLSYFARAHLDDVTRSPSGGPGDQGWIDRTGARRWYGQGLRQGYDNIIKRLIVEAWLLPANPIPAVFDHLGSGAGSHNVQITAESSRDFEGYFESPVGANLLDEILRILQLAGMDIWIDPDTFLTRVVDFDALAVDRTGDFGGAGVVRFEAGVNIAADLTKAIHHTPYASHLVVQANSGMSTIVVVDPAWSAGEPIRYGQFDVEGEDVTEAHMAIAGAQELTRRKIRADQPTFPHLYGNDETDGLYTPSERDTSGALVDGNYAMGDYVTLHAPRYNEQTIQVAAVNWNMRASGLFEPVVELGSQYQSRDSAALDKRIGTIGGGSGCRCLRLCSGNEEEYLEGLPSGQLKSSNAGGGATTNAVDRDEDTRWSPAQSLGPSADHWFAADLGSSRMANAFRLITKAPAPVGDFASDLTLYGSNDAGAWSSLPSGKLTGDPTASGWVAVSGYSGQTFPVDAHIGFSDATYRYWLWLADAGGAGVDDEFDINELYLYGLDCPTEPVGDACATGTMTCAAHGDHGHRHGLLDAAPPYHAADGITYDSTSSGLAADELQGAVDELDGRIDDHETRLDELEGGEAEGYVLARHGGREVVNGVSAPFSPFPLDLADGNWHDVTLQADVVELELTGALNGTGVSALLLLRQDATGGRAWSIPGVSWPGGVEPTPTLTPHAVDVVTLLSDDGGATWFGQVAGQASGASLNGSRFVVDSGTPTYDDTTDPGNVIVSVTSQWGIDSSGDPYFNSAGVTSGEEAALIRDPDTGEYLLRSYAF